MSSNNVNLENANQDELVLRDLQVLLRKSIGDEVEVVDFTTSSLLPKGENYASTMLKLDVRIKKRKSSPVEDLPLVAKMIPTGEYHKIDINSTISFAKEIFVFEKLVQAFREVEQEAGLRDEEFFDILPKYYGGRLTRNKETPEEADGDAVILMENLKMRGYNVKNRIEGLDFIHAKLAITELARFHALGMAVKHKRPEIFETARKALSKQPLVMGGPVFAELWKYAYTALRADPRIAKYEERITASVNTEEGWDVLRQSEAAVEPWVSVAHGDFWVNNIMFHQVDDKVDDVKFVDFQLASVWSPLKDLPYFLCGSVSPDVIDHHFDDLLDAYHERLVEVLDKVGCDSSAFTKDAFRVQLKKDAKGELMRCLIALKVFTLDMPQDINMDEAKMYILMFEASSLFVERSWKIISKFVEVEWL